MLNNLNIGKRLLLGFAVLLLCALIAGSVEPAAAAAASMVQQAGALAQAVSVFKLGEAEGRVPAHPAMRRRLAINS
jgi:hypothetical protein